VIGSDGYDTGGPGGWARQPQPEAVRETWERYTDWLRERVDDVLEPVWDLVGRVVEVARWVLERVAVVYPVHFERWETGADERVCPECGPLGGMVFEEGEVPPGAGVHGVADALCRRMAAAMDDADGVGVAGDGVGVR
jgi:hypothetical protein